MKGGAIILRWHHVHICSTSRPTGPDWFGFRAGELAAVLTDVVGTIADVGGYFLNTLAVQNCDLLSERTGQLLIDGSEQQIRLKQ